MLRGCNRPPHFLADRRAAQRTDARRQIMRKLSKGVQRLARCVRSLHSLEAEFADSPHFDLLLQVFDFITLEGICQFSELGHVIGISHVEHIEIKPCQSASGG